MEIATIGFTRTSAESFFGRIAGSGVEEVWDVRLHNTSQLAGFAKRDDMAYFLKSICGVGYQFVPEFAPEPEMLTAYRARAIDWPAYEQAYCDTLRSRPLASILERLPSYAGVALLCSEDKPDRCHRRLAAEYVGRLLPGVTIRHL